MAARRPFGTIRERGGRYQARYQAPDGTEHVSTHPSKAAAGRWLAAAQTDRERGAWVNPRGGRVSLATYGAAWLERRTDLRPTTRGKYETLLRLHMVPKLGRTELGKLSPSTVRAWYLDLRGRHAVTADDAYRLLRAILNTAVADEVIVTNPCKVRGAGQVRSPERPTASVAELAAAVEATPERFRAAILLAAWCQLRRGEVLGLTRRDVDLLHATVRIERAWVRPPGTPPLIGPPKTEKGTRTLAIPANVVPVLAEHLERFTGPEAGAWLFPAVNGAPMQPSSLDRLWRRARAAAGRPDLHLHDLRHSGLTWAAASGASVAELMRRGGHATPSAALRYQHSSEDRDATLAAALAAMATPAPVVQIRGTDHAGEATP